MEMFCKPNNTYTVLALNQSPGDFVIFWNVLVPLSVVPSMLHFCLRKHELFLFLALLLNPFILEHISRSQILSWVVMVFLMMVAYSVLRRWPWYNIYTSRFLFKLIILTVFLAIPDMIITYAWTSLHTGLYTVIKKAGPSLQLAQVAGFTNSVLIVGASLLLLHSIYFYSMYHACACRFWAESQHNICYRPKPDRCKTTPLPNCWRWLKRNFLKTENCCKNR